MAQGASFRAYLSQFRGLFKEFDAKTGGRASPAPPPPLDPRLPEVNNKHGYRPNVTDDISDTMHLRLIFLKKNEIVLRIYQLSKK